MRFQDSGSGFALWLSARETYAWAHRTGSSWPCSFLEGRRLFVGFDRNGLCDLTIDGGRGDQDCPGDELSAIVADHAKRKLGKDHPCYFVAIGQFEATT